jgi:GMP synthase-like glutamine amidotransferase
VHVPEDQGVHEVVGDWPGTWRRFRPALAPGDGPTLRTGHDTDGVVVLGSAASVHDGAGWIADLARWLEPLLDGRRPIPVLAICFGHQIVAHVAGGQVGWVHPDRRKIVGVDSVRMHDSRILEGETTLRAVFSHREEVQRAPDGYRIVAGRTERSLDGLEHAELPVFTCQFHPEARDEFARRAGIAPGDVDARVVADTRRLLAAFRSTVLREKARTEERGSGGEPPHRGRQS